jgi:elongation factor P
MLIPATQLRVGMIIALKGDLFRVTYMHHLTPGNKRGLIQTKLKNLKTGSHIDQRFRSDDTIEKATLEEREMEYLYNSGSHYIFMDTETYEQISLDADMLDDALYYLPPNQRVSVEFYEGVPVGIELPPTVNLKVISTEPGLKKATATASTKPATLETGLVIQVPHFIEPNEVITVNTSDGEYVERTKL